MHGFKLVREVDYYLKWIVMVTHLPDEYGPVGLDEHTIEVLPGNYWVPSSFVGLVAVFADEALATAAARRYARYPRRILTRCWWCNYGECPGTPR